LRLKLYNFGFLILVLSPSAFTKSVTMSVRYDGKQKALILDLRWLIKLNKIISTVLLFTLITTAWLPLSCYRLASVSIHSFDWKRKWL